MAELADVAVARERVATERQARMGPCAVREPSGSPEQDVTD